MPLVLLASGVAWAALAHAQNSPATGTTSWTDSVSNGVKQGWNKLGQVVNPKLAPAPCPEDDAVSLKTKAKAGPDLYVAVARLYEESNKLAEAEQHYQSALREYPDHLPALLGYAQLKERLERPDDALRLYQRALKAHAQNAAVHNNIGLCHARQGRLDDAIAALTRAVQLDPKNRLYRNNLAAVLVDRGRPHDAFAYLRETHGEATAYYNVGYLLNKRGQTQAAIQQFNLALRADPSLESARRWVDYLQGGAAQAQPRKVSEPARISSRPVMPPSDVLLSPEASTPRRLPPVTTREPQAEVAPLPGISYDRPAATAAPMPPPSMNALPASP